MKVIHIITALPTGGAQVMLHKLLSSMDRERFDPVVVSLRNQGTFGEKITALNVPVHTVGMKFGVPTPVAMWRLIRTVYLLQPDVIQGWMYHGNLAAQFAGAFAPRHVPVLWNIRGSSYILSDEKPMTAVTIWLGAWLSALPAKIINNSKESALKHEERLSYRADKRVIIPNGFDTTVFAPSTEARASIRSEIGLAEDAILIGLIARFHPMKDHANFLQAASLLSTSHPQIHFVLAGEGIDKANAQLSRLINKSDVSARVYLLGERTDTSQVTAALDVATSSSAYGEGFPNVLGEAMACGVPCVVTDVGDSARVVGETGEVVPPRDAHALAGAWMRLIEMGREGRRRLGMLARRRVEEKFSLGAVVNQYEALYEHVVTTMRGKVRE